MFTSGHMFNAIRHTPYISSDGRGGFNYIAGGFQNQFGIETQIVAAICIFSPIPLRFFCRFLLPSFSSSVVLSLRDKTKCRWLVGIYDDCLGAQGTYYSRSYGAEYSHLGLECRDYVCVF